jgi:hypothetical protein
MINTIHIYIIYIGLPYELDAMTLDTLGEVCYICVLILLYMCPHTICVLMCPHTYVSSYLMR